MKPTTLQPLKIPTETLMQIELQGGYDAKIFEPKKPSIWARLFRRAK